MLYERARQLQSKGLSAAEIHRALLSEGASEEDIKVILGSVGLGPAAHPDPTPEPLRLARRVMESRPMRFVVFIIGATAVGALLYVFWIVAVIVRGVAEGLLRGR